ncbi:MULTISPECIES: hypothetical protein [Acinetobacter]|nr:MULTISPECIES: hypothetical protein [Acinetobacter]
MVKLLFIRFISIFWVNYLGAHHFLHKKAGRSAQALAGHSSVKMTEHYEAGHEIVWNDVDVGIALPFAGMT